MKLRPMAMAVLALGIAPMARAAPPANITNTVGVCDPNAPSHCEAPNASGQVVMSGSVYGPTAAGSAGSTLYPPIVLAGTLGGSATGTINNLQVDSSFNLHVVETNSASLLSAAQAAIPLSILTAPPTYTTGTTQAATGTVRGAMRTSADMETTASTAINVATAATFQLVPLIAGQAIYVTNVNFVAAGVDNVTLEYGTGTLCGTGLTILTGAMPMVANGRVTMGSGVAPVLVVPAGNALCLVNSAASQLSGSVAYAQQ